MFDELGAVNIGNEDWCHEWFVQLLHQVDSVLALRANHNAIRMHEIGNCTTFAQKFGIADDVEVCAVTIVSLDRFSHLFACFHRHRAFVHDHPIIRQHARDFARDFLEKAQIDIAISLLWGWNGDKNDLCVVHAVLNAAAETQSLG